LMVG